MATGAIKFLSGFQETLSVSVELVHPSPFTGVCGKDFSRSWVIEAIVESGESSSIRETF